MPAARKEAAGYELTAGCTVTDMSITDWQRLSDVFHKCDNKSAMCHETIWIVREENKSLDIHVSVHHYVITLTEVFLDLIEVFLTLTEVFPCFFLSCKANARVVAAYISSPYWCVCVVQCAESLHSDSIV